MEDTKEQKEAWEGQRIEQAETSASTDMTASAVVPSITERHCPHDSTELIPLLDSPDKRCPACGTVYRQEALAKL